MDLTASDRALLAALAEGLPLSERPYADLGAALGLDEATVLARLAALQEGGVIRRFGVVVRHRPLGFTANAMVVWDIPEAQVAEAGRRLATAPEVRLCYRRPRRPGRWPYTLFCMVHGRDRDTVTAQVAALARRLDLDGYEHRILFSSRCFKQCGARYGKAA